MLYPKPILARAFERDPEIARKVWTYLNGIDMPSLLGEGRVYGGGLYKMEPKELANVPAEAIAGPCCRTKHANRAERSKKPCGR